MLKKYNVILILLVLAMIGVTYLAYDYWNYEKKVPESEHAIVYVDGSLSFNFIDGNVIKTKDKSKTYHFSVTNTSNDAFYYSLHVKNNHENHAKYKVSSNREGFKTVEKTFTEGSYTYGNMIKINGMETHSYDFVVENEEEELIEANLEITIENEMNTFANVILKNNVISEASVSKLGEEISRGSEGLIESTDDYGTSYYFRGSASNNYVSFAGLLWRVVKVNGDGTVKLILNSLSSERDRFYENGDENSLIFETSILYQNLKTWYLEHLNAYDNMIANTKYCTDDSIGNTNNGTFEFTSLIRIYTDHDPIFQCIGKSTTLKVGLLTADEVSFAGANNKNNNHDFYLYQSDIKSGWWTMTPATQNNQVYSFVEVSADGILNKGTTGSLYRGVRPVINLIKKTVVSGTGSSSDPYIVNLT